MSQPSLAVAVVMERTPLENNRWQSEKWEPIDVVPDASEPGAVPRALVENEVRTQWLHPGFKLELFRDEEGAGVPKAVTVSYNEAARLMDAGARVDGVPMPPQWIPWLAEYVERNYKPEPKKRSRPPSFKGAKRDDR